MSDSRNKCMACRYLLRYPGCSANVMYTLIAIAEVVKMTAYANLICKSERECLSPSNNSCLRLLTIIAVFTTSATIKFCLLGEWSQTLFPTKSYNCSLFVDQNKGGFYTLQEVDVET